MRAKLCGRLLAAFAVSIAIASTIAEAEASYLTIASGQLRVDDGTLERSFKPAASGTEWDDATLGWAVEFDASILTFRYTYTFNDDGKNLSHLGIEVSSNFTTDDLLSGSTTAVLETINSSPTTIDGTTNEMYGLKYNKVAGVNPTVAIVYTKRVPVWGDAHMADGTVFAENSGYAAADPISTIVYSSIVSSQLGIRNYGWLAVPDTIVINPQGNGDIVPEPTSMALAGFAGIGMAIGAVRRRRQSKAEAACG